MKSSSNPSPFYTVQLHNLDTGDILKEISCAEEMAPDELAKWYEGIHQEALFWENLGIDVEIKVPSVMESLVKSLVKNNQSKADNGIQENLQSDWQEDWQKEH